MEQTYHGTRREALPHIQSIEAFLVGYLLAHQHRHNTQGLLTRNTLVTAAEEAGHDCSLVEYVLLSRSNDGLFGLDNEWNYSIRDLTARRTPEEYTQLLRELQL